MRRNRMVAAGALAAVAVAVPASGATAGDAPVAQTSQRGLAVTPSIVESTARRGAARGVTIRNDTGRAYRITVTPRSWIQYRSGRVQARRSGGLTGVGVNVRRFTMPNGARRIITVRMRRVPGLRAQYGALEIFARPTVRRRGINVAGRLVPSLRFRPTARNRRIRLGAGSALVSGRTLRLPVVNRGNVLSVVRGTVNVSGQGRARRFAVSSGVVQILPGRTVDVRVGSLRGLPRGRYRASIRLTQNGRTALRAGRAFRIR